MRSGVLSYVREHLADQKSIIFDLGPPTSKKCTYLCSSGAQVYWDNMRGSISDTFHRGNDKTYPKMLKKWKPPTFADSLNLVLAWAYFEYLELDDIKKLCDKLNRCLSPGSRLYFLIHHSQEIPDTVPVFELESDDMLTYTTKSGRRSAPRYPPKLLEEMMPGFEIEKLFLMANGVQEHLFYKRY